MPGRENLGTRRLVHQTNNSKIFGDSMKLFARVFVLALSLVFIAASSAEAQRGPGGGGRGPGMGRGGPGGGGPRGPGPGMGRPSRPGGGGTIGGGPRHGGPRGGSGSWGRPSRHGGGPRRGGTVIYRPVPYPYPSGYCGLYGDCYGGSYYGSTEVNCAPEIVEGNTKATERTLATLVKSSTFAEAKTFKAEVARIAAIKDNSDKTNNYLALVGIDPENSEAVVEFIGSRDAKGAWLNDLEKNSGLSSAQAEEVAKAIQTALRGGLN